MIVEKAGRRVGGVDFTSREVDVLACLAANQVSTKQISLLLDISPKTINIHVGNILSKIGSHSRSQIELFISRSKEKNDLNDFFQRVIWRAFSIREVLKKMAKSLPHPKVTYHLVRDKISKEKADLIQSHFHNLAINVKLLARTYQEPCHPHAWVVYPSPSSNAWVIVPPLQDSLPRVPEKAVLLDGSENESVFSLFLKILRATVSEEWVNKLYTQLSDEAKNPHPPQIAYKRYGLDRVRRSYVMMLLATFITIAASFVIVANIPVVCVTNISHALSYDYFLERPALQDELSRIYSLKKGVESVGLLGPGGAGKTSLARHFAQKQSTSMIWEVRAESDDKIRESFEELADVLAYTAEKKQELNIIHNLQDPEKKAREILLFVQKILRKKDNWILIYDNLESADMGSKYFPNDTQHWGEGFVIYTSRNGNLKSSSHIGSFIDVGEMSHQEALDLMKIIVERRKVPMAHVGNPEILFQVLPCFPLDIAMATHYVCDLNLTCQNYVESLQKSHPQFDDVQKEVWGNVSDYKQTRFAITQLIASAISNAQPQNARLLLLVSLLDSQEIPRALLYHLEDSAVVDHFIHDLKKYSLIVGQQGRADHYTFSMHRLTQTMLRHAFSEYDIDIKKLVSGVDEYVFKKIEQGNYKIFNKFIHHMEALRAHTRYPLVSIGLLYYKAGFYKKAAQEIEEALSLPGLDEDKRCTLYFYAGQAYKNMLKPKESQEAFQKGIEICKKDALHDSARLIRFYTNLAALYRWKRDYEQSRKMCELALDLYEKSSDKHEESIMEAHAILGGMYRETRDYKKAEECLSRSIKMYRRHASNYPLDFARALLMLGGVYIEQGLFERALPLYKESLPLHEKNLAPSDVKLAWCYARIGNLYRLLGQNSKAITFLEKSGKTCMEESASHQLRWAQMNEDLAYIYVDREQLDQAMECAEKVRTVYTNIYGSEDGKTARAQNVCAYVYLKMGKFDEAEHLLKEALEVFEKKQHPLRYMSLSYLAELYDGKGRKGSRAEAATYKEKALQYITQSLSVTESFFPAESHYVKAVRRMKHRLENK